MKLVGFIKEYDDIREAIPFNEMTTSLPIEVSMLTAIVQYLMNGVLLVGWMGYVLDYKTKEPICPSGYYTDGYWVWPGYFAYYLQKGVNLMSNVEFLNYLEARNFTMNIPKGFDKTESYKWELELLDKLTKGGTVDE